MFTYMSRGGNFGTKIDTCASCGSQLPPIPYFPSSASNSDGIMGNLYVFWFPFNKSIDDLWDFSFRFHKNKYLQRKSIKKNKKFDKF